VWRTIDGPAGGGGKGGDLAGGETLLSRSLVHEEGRGDDPNNYKNQERGKEREISGKGALFVQEKSGAQLRLSKKKKRKRILPWLGRGEGGSGPNKRPSFLGGRRFRGAEEEDHKEEKKKKGGRAGSLKEVKRTFIYSLLGRIILPRQKERERIFQSQMEKKTARNNGVKGDEL